MKRYNPKNKFSGGVSAFWRKCDPSWRYNKVKYVEQRREKKNQITYTASQAFARIKKTTERRRSSTEKTSKEMRKKRTSFKSWNVLGAGDEWEPSESERVRRWSERACLNRKIEAGNLWYNCLVELTRERYKQKRGQILRVGSSGGKRALEKPSYCRVEDLLDLMWLRWSLLPGESTPWWRSESLTTFITGLTWLLRVTWTFDVSAGLESCLTKGGSDQSWARNGGWDGKSIIRPDSCRWYWCWRGRRAFLMTHWRTERFESGLEVGGWAFLDSNLPSFLHLQAL